VKTIGIVGGLAWPSSVIYQTINELVATRLGALHCARLVLAQTDFDQVERYQREGRWDLVGDLLAAQAGHLKAAGADFFLLACNTVHTASERIEKLAGLPFLHIVDPTARQIQQAGFTTVGLLGSRYTMTGTYFAGRLPALRTERPGRRGRAPGQRAQRAVCRAGPRRSPARHPRQVPGRDHRPGGAAPRSSSWPAPSSAWWWRPGTARYRSLIRPSPTPRPPSTWHWLTNLWSPAPEPVHCPELPPGRDHRQYRHRDHAPCNHRPAEATGREPAVTTAWPLYPAT
jgi:Asp/Glu/Hydantoin racemase